MTWRRCVPVTLLTPIDHRKHLHCSLQDAPRSTTWPDETPLKEKLRGDLAEMCPCDTAPID